MNSTHFSPRSKFLISLASVLVAGMSALPGQASAANYDETCGLLPGEGGYGYVRVANMSCRHGKKVAFKGRKKFCKQHFDCRINWKKNIGKIYRGQVRRNGWKCKVTVGWELLRVKCRKGNRRTIYRGGA